MSRHDDVDLDDLFRRARAERPPQRWREQRDLFRLLRLGGPTTLLATRIAHALAALPPRAIVGTASVALVATVAAGATYLAPGDGWSSGRAGAPPSSEVVSDERVLGGEGAPAPIAAPASDHPLPSNPHVASDPHVATSEPAIATTSIDALPSAPRPVPRVRNTTAASASASPGDELARELASISRIRAKVAAHDYASARDGVRIHRASFPHSVLAQEISVLEIEASRGLGDHAATCSIGRAFLDAHPTSAHRESVLGFMRDCASSPSGAP